MHQIGKYYAYADKNRANLHLLKAEPEEANASAICSACQLISLKNPMNTTFKIALAATDIKPTRTGVLYLAAHRNLVQIL